MAKSNVIEKCVLCAGKVLPEFDFGNLPLPNRLPQKDDPPDDLYPLDIVRCQSCGLVQLGHSVDPEIMFSDYTYTPSHSVFLRKHFAELAVLAADAVDELSGVPPLAIDIGGNDGLLLWSLTKARRYRVLNIDAASNIASLARERGVATMVRLFDEEVAKEVVMDYGAARLVFATNCLAHTANLASYLRGVKMILDKEGMFVVEVPYLVSLVQGFRFDTIYHEHQSYFTVGPLYSQLPRFGLRLQNMEYLPDVHGGSLRLWITHEEAKRQSSSSDNPIDMFVLLEEKLDLPSFWLQLERLRDELRLQISSMLDGRVVGIGASAKAAVLLNYCGIGPELISMIADASPLKQGRAIPGVRIPIVPEKRLAGADYVVDFIWNLKSDVEEKMRRYCPGAKLVELLPEFSVGDTDE